jgi:hypothetical protein
VDVFNHHENIEGQRPPSVEISEFLLNLPKFDIVEKLETTDKISPLTDYHFYISGLQNTEGVKWISLTFLKIFKVKGRPASIFRKFCLIYQGLTW